MYSTLRNQISHQSIFQELLRKPRAHVNQQTHSLYTTDSGWSLQTDLPGFTKEEINLRVEQSVLYLVADSDDEERSHRGAIEHQFALGEDVNIAMIKAKLEHGILTIELPKKEPEQPKSIEINIES